MKRILLIISCCLLLTGCVKDNNFESDYTYTTIYPIEYVTSELFSDYSNIKSIYPNGVNTNTYDIKEKKLNSFAQGNTFVYDGLSNEVNIAVNLLNINQNIEIIDAMKGMNYKYGIQELWLDPSHYLMVARNIKAGLIEYEDNIYTKEKIENNYENLKIKISELDVELTLIGKNSNYSTMIVANDVLKYLAKYNINVISLDANNNNNIDKSFSEAKKLIQNQEILYLFTTDKENLTETLTNFANLYKLEILEIDTLEVLTEEQRKKSANYLSIMTENIDQIKKELLK